MTFSSVRLVVMFLTSLCSSNPVPNVLPVSPIYVWLQLLQGVWYTQSVFLISSTLSFGLTSILLMFWWGLSDVAISCCFKIRCMGSVTPLTHGRVTISLDFSVFFSFFSLFFPSEIAVLTPSLWSNFGTHIFLVLWWCVPPLSFLALMRCCYIYPVTFWWPLVSGVMWDVKFRYWSVCVFFRYTRSFNGPSPFRIISVPRKGRELSLSST